MVYPLNVRLLNIRKGATNDTSKYMNEAKVESIFLNPYVGWKVKVAHSLSLFAAHGLFTDCGLYGILQARILEWVGVPFSRGSSQPRDQTQVSCIAGGFLISWATKEALKYAL